MKHKPTFLTATLLAAVIITLAAAPAVLAYEGKGYGPGRVALELLAGRDHFSVGDGGIWNSKDKLHIQLEPAGGWRLATQGLLHRPGF